MIKGLYILIPAKNEQKNISKVIKIFKKSGKVVIINDNSTDLTYKLSKKNSFKIISNNDDKGYDFSIKKGIEFIIKRKDAKYIMTIDGDGQHPSVNFKKIIKYMKTYDLIIFNRKKLARISEYFVNIVSNFFFSIKDPLSGMKLYKVSILKKNFFKINKNIDYVGMFFFKIYKKKNKLNLEIKTKKSNKISSFGKGLATNVKIINSFIKSL